MGLDFMEFYGFLQDKPDAALMKSRTATSVNPPDLMSGWQQN
jgi:hypothetical protein